MSELVQIRILPWKSSGPVFDAPSIIRNKEEDETSRWQCASKRLSLVWPCSG